MRDSDLKNALFPSHIAQNDAFCDRDTERAALKYAIEQNRHTLVISPRRYGKTSLIHRVLVEGNYIHGYVQFFNALNNEIVAARLVEGFAKLLNSFKPKTQKAIQKLQSILTQTRLSVGVGETEFTIQVNPIAKQPREIIAGVFNDIASFANSEKVSLVLFFDEFQDVTQSDISDELQAIMRDFTQFSQYVTVIISGSRRHMLESIFDDRSKPFYKLFDKFMLGRISAEDHIAFINKYAQKKWGSILSDVACQKIIELTECHTYYVNKLCYKLWQFSFLPDETMVEKCWFRVESEEFSAVANGLSLLTKNQRLVLAAMSKFDVVTEPNSSSFINACTIPPASVVQSLDALHKKDFVEKTTQGMRVVDPLIKSVLK